MRSNTGTLHQNNWKYLAVSEFADVVTGGTPRTSIKEFWENGNIPWLPSGNLKFNKIDSANKFITDLGLEKSSAKLMPINTVVIAMTGATLGRVGVLGIEASANQSVTGILPNDTTEPKFLFYFLWSSYHKIISEAGGSAQPGINQKYVKNLPIPIPPLQEQKRIVAKIDTLFAKIDKAINLTEESLKQAENLLPSILKEVFEKGKADGWEEKRLEEVASYDKSKYKGHNRPYVGLEHIESNTSIFLGNKEPLNVKSSTFMFDKRHVLYGRLRPYLNKVLVPDFNGHCSTEIFPILTNGKLIRRYLAYWLMSPVTNAKIDATWTGARMPRANMNEVIKFKLPMPTKETQKSIVDLFDDFSNQSKQTQSKLEEQLAYLKQLKSSILSKAFKGEL